MKELPGSLHSADGLSAEIQRKEMGQKANARSLSNDFSSTEISARKARRRMTLFYSPINNAHSCEEEEIGWIDVYALEGMLTSIEVFKEQSLTLVLGDPACSLLPIKDAVRIAPGSSLLQNINLQAIRCENEHHHCPHHGGMMPYLPARIIKVGSERETPVLHITQDAERGNYIALSYCWGGNQKTTTTIATLQSRINGLPFEELPQTIKEAIILTRVLGFQYLWIDALCIIQDSPLDKAADINNMGAIYKNASMTIAAAKSKSVDIGFLHSVSAEYSCLLPFKMQNGMLGNIYFELDSEWSRPLPPLDSRGWTFQEDLLSPRILYFGYDGLTWKCQSERVDLVSGKKYNFVGRTLPSEIFTGTGASEVSDFDLAKTWKDVVEKLSGRAFTFAEDRLPALAGIAGEIMKLLPGELTTTAYLAGLWKPWLIMHLGWYNNNGHSTYVGAAHPGRRRSPSWSWISIESAVTIDDVHNDPSMSLEILDCTTNLVISSSPFGEVCGGRLTLYGYAAAHPLSTLQRSRLDLGNEAYINAETMECLALYLGQSSQKRAVGLILQPLENGNFIRIGQLSIEKDGKERLWPSDLEPVVVVIE